MNLANLADLALSMAKLHPAASLAGLVVFVLFAVGWAIRWSLALRRRRERPLALIVADAIAHGSVHGMERAEDHSPPVPAPPASQQQSEKPAEAFARARLRLSAYQKLSEGGDKWGFSLNEAEGSIATFIYPGQEEARAAHKAMRRALKDLTCVLQPTVAPGARAEMDPAAFRPQRVWTERPAEPDFGPGIRTSA